MAKAKTIMAVINDFGDLDGPNYYISEKPAEQWEIDDHNNGARYSKVVVEMRVSEHKRLLALQEKRYQLRETLTKLFEANK